MSTIGDSEQGCKAKEHVTVIGGGLVGPLLAVILGQRGFDVHLYESRSDIRTQVKSGRSINLTLSNRGLEALRSVGLEDEVLGKAIPIPARKVHTIEGKTYCLPYGTKEGECIYSISRPALNQLLLTKAEENSNVSVHFEHKLLQADLEGKILTFSAKGTAETIVETKFIFGCDGAYSTVRREMMRCGRLNYQQEYIKHGYKELTLPATQDGESAMELNFLHIWPRHEFMMIALPNHDKTFTLTLFMPFKVFESIKSKEDLLAFFTKYFPDTIEKISVQQLFQDYFKNPLGKLISVKCSPHYMAKSTLILGDAAHAVVPFYGQGVNAGFEDCLIFSELLSQNDNDILVAAQAYEDTHWADTQAICDLSLHNYLDIRSRVLSPAFVVQQKIDSILHSIFPRYFIPLYSMVVFSRIPYHQVVERNALQRKAKCTLLLISLTSLGVLGYLAFKFFRMRASLSYRI